MHYSAEEKKVKAIYTLFEDEITQDEWEYTDEFKAELDRRYAHYKNGGKMVSTAESGKQVKELLKRQEEMSYRYIYEPAALIEYKEAISW